MFERCPFCKTMKQVAVRCFTCGFIAVAAVDPHAHNHSEKYVPQQTETVISATTSSSGTALTSGSSFRVYGWPPRST